MTTTKAPKKEETQASPTSGKKTDDNTVKEAANPAGGTNTALQQGTEMVAHAVDKVFLVLKTHFEKEKVDNWQKKWLAVPENRKKYEQLADAPVVMGEELLAVTNDIIDFIQGEDGSQSKIVKGLKGRFQPFFKHPVDSLKQEANKAADVAKEKAKQQAEKATVMAKETAKKGMEKGMDVAKDAAEKGKETAKKSAEKATDVAKETVKKTKPTGKNAKKPAAKKAKK